MPKFLVHFWVLVQQWRGGTSSTDGEDSLTMVGKGEAWDYVVFWATRGREKLKV